MDQCSVRWYLSFAVNQFCWFFIGDIKVDGYSTDQWDSERGLHNIKTLDDPKFHIMPIVTPSSPMKVYSGLTWRCLQVFISNRLYRCECTQHACLPPLSPGRL